MMNDLYLVFGHNAEINMFGAAPFVFETHKAAELFCKQCDFPTAIHRVELVSELAMRIYVKNNKKKNNGTHPRK